MEKNEFLLFNEIIYRLNTAVDLDDLRRALAARCGLTRREEEIVDLIFRDRRTRRSSPRCTSPATLS